MPGIDAGAVRDIKRTSSHIRAHLFWRSPPLILPFVYDGALLSVPPQALTERVLLESHSQGARFFSVDSSGLETKKGPFIPFFSELSMPHIVF